jgi:hypothetical protein
MRDGGTFEGCQNVQTGLYDGPARGFRKDGTLALECSYSNGHLQGDHYRYDDSGTVVYVESKYENGKQLSSRATLAGLREVIAYANQAERNKGSGWRLSVIDLHRVRYTKTVGFIGSLFLPDGKALRRLVRESGDMCAVMHTPPTDVRSIDVRYEDGDGDLIDEFTIRREECTARKTPADRDRSPQESG